MKDHSPADDAQATPATEVPQEGPPQHILAGFQVPTATPVQLGEAWNYGWRCDRAVISATDDPSRATWIAKTMATMRPAGVGVARPMFSSDGRYSVSGWRARTFLSGFPSPRFDEMAAAALRINEALRGVAQPTFLQPPAPDQRWDEWDLFSAAEAAAFSDNPAGWITPVLAEDTVPRDDVAQALATAVDIAGLRRELNEEDQLVHGDVLGCMIFAGAADPVITDLVPSWRPAGWSVALLIVDAMAWGNGPDALLDRWSHIPDFLQLALRAALYRLVLHALLPDAQPEALPGLRRTAEVVAAKAQEEILQSAEDTN